MASDAELATAEVVARAVEWRSYFTRDAITLANDQLEDAVHALTSVRGHDTLDRRG